MTLAEKIKYVKEHYWVTYVFMEKTIGTDKNYCIDGLCHILTDNIDH